ncbi:MAG: sulfur oxidation c-type cytochrome SoxA [Acetobacteraceae bacterium SCN 69-10]|nr:sulfur oxidation c-type cytochrome SoxA [Rhodospirillales bacterium]ODU54511.1 MAG: sulfur oxidation c-type cytochrome SoxA [Acetobacteraceae bacterium SCN 69-10]OJY76343.1 MAG: sulfur oxidation c-type cytochrome SoxA [Rhodospirillales bacterium 70-18]
MRKFRGAAALILVAGLLAGAAPAPAASLASAAADQKAFQDNFRSRFPAVPFADFANGPYSVNAPMRKQWEEIMQFPPYDFALDEGKTEFAKPFANGKTYADCFPNGGIGIRQDFPYFDGKTGEVVTLDLAINRCRQANGEKPLKYQTGMMASLTAYMAETSRGKPFDIKIPDDPRALAAYEAGKKYFYTRRGQLNFACASCHVGAAGQRMRGDILAPALGILAAFPIYRSDWGSMGTIDRRFTSCSAQMRSTPLPPQDPAYRNLEYFLSYMSNGVPISGPGTRP